MLMYQVISLALLVLFFNKTYQDNVVSISQEQYHNSGKKRKNEVYNTVNTSNT